ncbi:MAG: CPBP family intramembrane metalloprotease [Ruminococcaceae bacterium]|nr:CPBP family intramembrane metalloprotease [Oscillospiraceae bacterium]
MRMLFYYFRHSAWNQFRKLFRTWVFLLTVGFLLALFAVWQLVVWYYHRLAAESVLPDSWAELLEMNSVTGVNVAELFAGLLILGILVIQSVGAEKSVSNLFLQSDVNLLFASALSPQRVLIFRLLTTMGPAALCTVLLCLELPSLAGRFSLTPYAAFAIPAAWCLTMAFSVLLKVVIYEVGSTHPRFRRNLRWGIFAVLGVVGLAFYRLYRDSGEELLLRCASRFFNAPLMRWIPVWGWIKGFLGCALEGNIPLSLGLLALNAGLLAALAFAAGRIPADYYEETLSHAQELAMLMEELSGENPTLLVTGRRRYRREMERDGFRFGRGGSVYFFKALYNRFRFSRFGAITRTTVTYLCAALAAGLFDRWFLDKPVSYIPALALCVMAFFRTIVSPVTEDIRKASFLLQPTPIWGKLFYSLLGGSCNCVLDVALPLMVGTAAAGFSPLTGLLFLPVLFSVDFFAAAAGAFVDVSIPTAIGTSLKQIIQILLLYAGIIFDAIAVSSCIIAGNAALGFAAVTVLDLLFGSVFLGLAGVWLSPSEGLLPRTDGYVPDERGARRAATRVGLALAGMFLAIRGGQIALSAAPDVSPVLAVYLPIYAFGLPAFALLAGPKWVLRQLGAKHGCEERGLGVRRFFSIFPVCFFVMYGGNLMGLLLDELFHSVVRFSLPLPQIEAPSGVSPPVQALILALAAPLMEEFVFRRCVMERLLPYGEKMALFASALLFALFHSSIPQACYAFLLGLVFGYVYLRTRRLRYTIALHVVINGMSAVVLPALINLAYDAMPDAMFSEVRWSAVIGEPRVLLLLLYLAALLLLSLLGSVLFFYRVRNREISADGVRFRTVLSAWGVLLFAAMAAVSILSV